MIVRMHHFGMMVNDLEKEIKTYESFGFKVFKRFGKPGIKAAMMFKGDAGIELFEFETPSGKLQTMTRKHSAFVSDDLENDIQKYIDRGYELAIPISKGDATKRWAYLKDKAGNYIELLEPADDPQAG